MRHGVIEHHAGSATVKVDYARPLEQAIIAVSEEYGWVVNYEDPPYGGRDVTDMTNPKYRATHPNAPVVLGPAGGAFQSTYAETPDVWGSPAAERGVLEKIIFDYNHSGGPGNFTLGQLSDGSFDVIGDSTHSYSGADVPTTPVLDTKISIPPERRDPITTITLILQAASRAANVSLGVGFLPMPAFGRFSVEAGGTNISARQLLMQVIDASGGKYNWSLNYEVQPPEYLLAVVPTKRAVYDSFGKRRLVPVSPAPLPSGSM